jgi:hypothetical protein
MLLAVHHTDLSLRWWHFEHGSGNTSLDGIHLAAREKYRSMSGKGAADNSADVLAGLSDLLTPLWFP